MAFNLVAPVGPRHCRPGRPARPGGHPASDERPVPAGAIRLIPLGCLHQCAGRSFAAGASRRLVVANSAAQSAGPPSAPRVGVIQPGLAQGGGARTRFRAGWVLPGALSLCSNGCSSDRRKRAAPPETARDSARPSMRREQRIVSHAEPAETASGLLMTQRSRVQIPPPLPVSAGQRPDRQKAVRPS